MEFCPYLFVYGTLLQPGNTFGAYLQAHGTLYAEGCFKGLLYNIGEYPGAVSVPYGDDLIHGTVFLMADADEALKVLDDYEGFGNDQPQPNEFVRELVGVEVNGTLLGCWVYLYNLDVEGLQRIELGKYIK